jgi:hypothetical protein
MDSAKIDEIVTTRLDSWKALMVKHHATPVVAVAVGHDHNSGQIRVLTVEDLNDKEMILFLETALQLLKHRKGKKDGSN